MKALGQFVFIIFLKHKTLFWKHIKALPLPFLQSFPLFLHCFLHILLHGGFLLVVLRFTRCPVSFKLNNTKLKCKSKRLYTCGKSICILQQFLFFLSDITWCRKLSNVRGRKTFKKFIETRVTPWTLSKVETQIVRPISDWFSLIYVFCWNCFFIFHTWSE